MNEYSNARLGTIWTALLVCTGCVVDAPAMAMKRAVSSKLMAVLYVIVDLESVGETANQKVRTYMVCCVIITAIIFYFGSKSVDGNY